MAFSSGTFSLYSPGNPVVTGTTIASTWANNTLNDIATGLSTCLLKDGSQTVTANIPMGGFKFTGLGAGSAAGNSLRYEQVNGLVTTAADTLVATGAGTLARVTASLASQNIGLAASVAASALTITLQGSNGSDQSSTNPGVFPFRNVTVATGTPSWLNGTAAASLVISSGSTMGARSAVPFRLWVVMFNDGGTLRIGAINCVTSAAGTGAGSDVTAIYPLSAWGIAGSTAEGGAGAADSAQTFYTGTAVSAKSFVVLGYMTWESGLTTAGTWDAAPTRIQLFGPGVPLPGQTLQVQRNSTGLVATGATVLPNDNTIPQSGEGDQYMSQAITPSSAATALRVKVQGTFAQSSNSTVTMALYQDATNNALAASNNDAGGTARIDSQQLEVVILSSGTVSTTFKVRAGGNAGATTTFNGAGGTQSMGGVMNSFTEVEEIQA